MKATPLYQAVSGLALICPGHPKALSGTGAFAYYYHGNHAGSLTTGAYPLADTSIYVPTQIGYFSIVQDMAFEVTTAAASTTADVALFSSHPDTGMPYKRLDFAVDIATTTTGLKTATIDATCLPGWYWRYLNCDSTSVSFRATAAANAVIILNTGNTGSGQPRPDTCLFSSQTQGTVPATAPTGMASTNATIPLIGMRFSA